MSRLSLDANVLIYSIDASDRARNRTAQRVVAMAASEDCTLALQTLAEFYFVATRKAKLVPAEAKSRVEELRALFALTLPGERTLRRAIELSEQDRIGFWDAMLIATLGEAGVTLLLTEDLQDNQVYAGVHCLNPFTRTTAQLERRLRAD